MYVACQPLLRETGFPHNQEFPRGLVVRIWRFHCHGRVRFRHENLFNLIDTLIARCAYEDNPLLSSLKGPCGAIGSAPDSRSEG